MPQAAFYLWARTPGDDAQFARALYAEQNVTVLPGSFIASDAHGTNPGRNRSASRSSRSRTSAPKPSSGSSGSLRRATYDASSRPATPRRQAPDGPKTGTAYNPRMASLAAPSLRPARRPRGAGARLPRPPADARADRRDQHRHRADPLGQRPAAVLASAAHLPDLRPVHRLRGERGCAVGQGAAVPAHARGDRRGRAGRRAARHRPQGLLDRVRARAVDGVRLEHRAGVPERPADHAAVLREVPRGARDGGAASRRGRAQPAREAGGRGRAQADAGAGRAALPVQHAGVGAIPHRNRSGARRTGCSVT